MLIAKLIIAVIPSILIGLFLYKRDLVEKETKGLLGKLFLGGCLSAILVIIITLIMSMISPYEAEPSNTLKLIIHAFITIALVEEISKFLFAYLISWHNKEFNYLYDALIYCVFVALGFATVENILFVLQGDLTTAIMRAISAVPGHACDAIFMGIYFGLAKIALVKRNDHLYRRYLALSIIVPTIIHGFYDFLILSQNDFFIFMFGFFIIALITIALKKLNMASKLTRGFSEQINKQ